MKHFIVLLILVALAFSFKSQAQQAQGESDIDLNQFESQQQGPNQNNLTNLSRQRDSEDIRDATPESSGFLENVFSGNQALSIPQIDEEVGIQLDAYSTDQDQSRASLGYQFSSNLRDLTGLSSLDFTYSRKFKKIWLEGHLSLTSAKTKRLTDYNPLVGTPSSELLEENSSLTQFGFGAMYRTTYIQNMISSSRFFETISAMATYNQFEDVVSEQSYSGFGVRADLGIHRRLSPAWHIGGKLSYNLSTVKREAEFEEEKPNQRSLLLRWVSVGVELSLYF